MDINVTDNHDVMVPGTDVTVKDAIVFQMEGEVIGRLDIRCDFTDLDPSLHQMAIDILMKNRIRMTLPSEEYYEKMRRMEERYEKRKAEYNALPWYKKMFNTAPSMAWSNATIPRPAGST